MRLVSIIISKLFLHAECDIFADQDQLNTLDAMAAADEPSLDSGEDNIDAQPELLVNYSSDDGEASNGDEW